MPSSRIGRDWAPGGGNTPPLCGRQSLLVCRAVQQKRAIPAPASPTRTPELPGGLTAPLLGSHGDSTRPRRRPMGRSLWLSAGVLCAGLAAVPTAVAVDFDRPRQAYDELHAASLASPDFDPGRHIIDHGLANGRPATEAQIERSNRIMWQGLHPDAPPLDGVSVGGAPANAHLAAIAQCESGGDPTAVSAGGQYRGLYQFSFSTWASVGGSGDPAAASPAEQHKRAAILYERAGASPWPVCGS